MKNGKMQMRCEQITRDTYRRRQMTSAETSDVF